MRVAADLGKVEYDVLLDYVEHVELKPGHPITPIYTAVRDVFRDEIGRRRVSVRKHRAAKSIDLPLEKLSPESLIELQDRVTELTKKMWPLRFFHAAQLFQSIGLACYELIREKLEQHTLH